MMAVDPVDDQTFWYTHEYPPQGTDRWATSAGAFEVIPKVVSISSTELDGNLYYEASESIGLDDVQVSAGSSVLLQVVRNGSIEVMSDFMAHYGSDFRLNIQENQNPRFSGTSSPHSPLQGHDGMTRAGIGVAGSQLDIQAESELYQNQPNPAEDFTIIRFRLNRSGPVNLTIYDITGRAVMVVVDGDLSLGNYSIPTDVSILPPGVYLYRMITTDAVETKRMVITR